MLWTRLIPSDGDAWFVAERDACGSSQLMILDLLPHSDNKSKIIEFLKGDRGESDFEDGRHEHGSAAVGLVDPAADGAPHDVFEGVRVANAISH